MNDKIIIPKNLIKLNLTIIIIRGDLLKVLCPGELGVLCHIFLKKLNQNLIIVYFLMI